jgi:ribosomal protein S18 acetylase RimI-like enzyme
MQLPVVKEDKIETVVVINNNIPEFDDAELTQQKFENRYAGSEHLILVSYMGDSPAGYLVALDRDKDGSFYAWMTGVDPKFRKQGHLSAMMEYLMKWCVENNYNVLKIKTRNTRKVMFDFLQAKGFKQVKQIENDDHIEYHLEKNLN